MPEMMGIVLLADLLAKDGRKPHEFQEVINRNRLSSRVSAAVKQFRLRWTR